MIYVTGDLHGELARFSERQMKVVKKRDTLLVCGDFGFVWDGSKEEQKALKALGKFPFTIAFVDGAHENFELLERLPVSEWCGGKVRRLQENTVQLMRGEIYEIEGERVFAFGGGESPDKDIRREDGHWWARELPSPEEIEEGRHNLEASFHEVDYIITHEPSAAVKGMLNIGEDYINSLNIFFDEVAKTCKFKRWFFGSCHVDKVISPRQIAVFGDVLPLDLNKKKR